MKRQAFTLLEVLLSLSIAVLLMGALYVAMDVQLRYAQAGRELVDQATLVRAVLARIETDVTAALSPITATPTITGVSLVDSVINYSSVAPFNCGIQGDAGQLVIYLSKVPTAQPANDEGDGTPVSDLRRIVYWMTETGLARQEITRVTADDESTQLPPGVPDEANLVIASEVRGFQVSFFDGTNWVDTWDGTELGTDGVTPIGPPRAVAIVVSVKRGDDGDVKKYRHVINVGAANATQSATATDPTTTSNATSSTTPTGTP